MSDGSILLELDGSAQARYAAEVAWSIGKANNVRVDALHVVDSLAAWDFLAFDIAGFIGSGPYFEAHDKMRDCLTAIGKNLIDVYSKLAKQNGVEGEAFLDDGSTIREICARAKDYDVVVMGHQGTGMGSPDDDKRKLPRRSVVETLTYYIPRPLLVVQDRCRMWSKARILVGSHPVPDTLLRNCVSFISGLSAEPSLRFLFTSHPGGDSKLKRDLTPPDGVKAISDISKIVPELTGKNMDARSTDDISEYLQQDAEKEADVLLVVPIIEQNGVRTTAFGITPDLMVRYLNHPAILFWMEELEPAKAPESGKSVSTAV
jgi:nucleotide-binding universal stress UspA family protein